ncbi:MAG TPA: tRNA pseudouridine(13) synthase TruD [Candidatus Thalassarchaeaceae archaeon]|nr:tRNA pseudouridine(13) synthase TruD [Candidatus Thalassarchaeaceae archaeon]MDP7658685.1 tRNA pseudouridine(13) synthase TruD [Candidatus Thalassarchaeaceae archaeon]HJO42070.1 tRNA pseudouridine(13) synthase TruD [Candidatus Thalassarchaeaceae archaeon]
MSQAEIEENLGLSGWAHDATGIGGLLKVRIEDFRVEEVARIPALDSKGRFTVVRATLTNWETNRFLRRLAGACGINRNRIFCSGLKDKRAVTTQILVIDAPQRKVESVNIPDSELEILGRTHQKVGMSDHDGNRFTITVRGCCDENGKPLEAKDAMQRVLEIRDGLASRLGADAFPNWIGPQRFGSTRPVTPEVGRAVVDGDFEKAVDLYLGMPGLKMKDDVSNFRKLWRESKDPKACLEIIPKHLGYERNILETLLDKPDNWVKAFRALPPSLQLLMVHSLQSLAFNHSLAFRIDSGLNLLEPEIGDLVAPVQASGRIDVSKMALVSQTNLERCRRNCRLGRLAVTGPLPGKESAIAQGEPGIHELAALERTNLANVDWKVKKIPNLTTSGTRRPLTVTFSTFSVEEAPSMLDEQTSERWELGPIGGDLWHPEGADLRLRFTLPPGTYATVLMREFMRSPLDHY